MEICRIFDLSIRRKTKTPAKMKTTPKFKIGQKVLDQMDSDCPIGTIVKIVSGIEKHAYKISFLYKGKQLVNGWVPELRLIALDF